MRIFKKRHPPVGSRPGTLVVPPEAVPPKIRVMQFDKAGVIQTPVEDPGDLRALVGRGRVAWIDVQGIGNEATIRQLGEIFQIHPLALEDIVNTPQRPNIEAYPNHLLLIARTFRLAVKNELQHEQVGIFVGADYVLTFQESYASAFEPVRQRVVEGIGPIRESGADYLAYALLDTIVDGYYPVIEGVTEALTKLEGRVLSRPSPTVLDRINQMKVVLAALHRGVHPQREALTHLLRDGSMFISANVKVYLRDTLDHCAQLNDIIETNRDLSTNLVNLYLSLVGARTNDVMKVLTIIATIFIPLSFLTGVYGMNFDIPELKWAYGYPTGLVVMAVCVAGMLLYFGRKGWLGGSDEGDDD